MNVDQQSATLFINVDTNLSATRGFTLTDFGDDSSSECFLHQSPQVEVRRVSESENNQRWMNDRFFLEQALKELRDFYDDINSQWVYRALDIWLLNRVSTGCDWGQS